MPSPSLPIALRPITPHPIGVSLPPPPALQPARHDRADLQPPALAQPGGRPVPAAHGAGDFGHHRVQRLRLAPLVHLLHQQLEQGLARAGRHVLQVRWARHARSACRLHVPPWPAVGGTCARCCMRTCCLLPCKPRVHARACPRKHAAAPLPLTPRAPAPARSPAPKQVASFPIGVWSGVFLLLSAIDHLLVVLPRVNAAYNRELCANRNPFRWAEVGAALRMGQRVGGRELVAGVRAWVRWAVESWACSPAGPFVDGSSKSPPPLCFSAVCHLSGAHAGWLGAGPASGWPATACLRGDVASAKHPATAGLCTTRPCLP